MKPTVIQRLLGTAILVLVPCLSLPADEPNRPVPKTDLDKARSELTAAEMRLQFTEVMNKKCAGFDLRHEQIRRGRIDPKVAMEEIQKTQTMLLHLSR